MRLGIDVAGTAPGVLRRLGAVLYDCLLLLALLFVASYLFLLGFGDATKPPLRTVYQGYLLAVCAIYFVGFWAYGGQTLAMKTWRFKLVSENGQQPELWRLWARFVLALPGLVLFWWAWVDRDHCFLHDRLAGTRLVMVGG